MGAVYRATDQILQRTVAIKILKEHSGEEVAKKIRLEAQILARLLHDNVVRLYDFGEANGTYFLVMEEVDGSSYHKRWKQLPLADRLRITAQVADALDYAHHQGVIHRDVKPANVLLTAADQSKLSDFGLSMIAEQMDDTGTIRGTPQYMSPEQARGKRLDHRTDLYSLGVMLYECATGSTPFQGPAMSILSQHINNPPVPPSSKNPEVWPELESLILSLLAKNPDDRPISGAVVAQLLREQVERGRAPRAVPVPGPTVEIPSPAAPTIGAVPATVAAPVAALPVGVPSESVPLVKRMLSTIVAEPITLSPDERYLCGHYLAYLLGGSRRQGILLRRPLDPRNADRGLLMLAMTYVMVAGASEESIARAVELLEEHPDVRPSLSPIVVAKYLAGRSTPARRKLFRQIRKQLLEASGYAQKNMVDSKGALNPGLMPQTLDNLRLIAPARTDVDDALVNRWNRVAEVWRGNPGFRESVLRYATRNAHNDPASTELWPEVVYPLIERARWQRHSRSNAEAIVDNFCAKVLHVPAAGVRLDRAIIASVPSQVVEQLDIEIEAFADDPQIEAETEQGDPQSQGVERLTQSLSKSGVSLHELASEQASGAKGMVLLTNPDPVRFTQGDLRELWQEAAATFKSGNRAGHRRVPVGPYRLAITPSLRGSTAGQVAIQGMLNKQIEMLTPSLRRGGSSSRPILAVWVYQNNSLAITYLDFKNSVRYIFWDAPTSQQSNYEDPAELNHLLLHLNMEAPDQLDRALSKRFRPSNPV